MFWIFFPLIVFVISYKADKIASSDKITFYFLLIVLTIILSYVSSFGSIIGQDHKTYQYIYESHTQWSDINFIRYGLQSVYQVEFGYQIVNVLGNKLKLGFPGFLFLFTFIINALFICVAFRFQKPYIVFFLFVISAYYMQEVNLVRQMLAVSLFLYSLHFLNEGKVKNYILLIIIASLFHSSAFYLLILGIIPFIKNSCFRINNNIVKYLFLFLWCISIFSIVGFEIVPIQIIMEHVAGGTSYERFIIGDDDAGAGVSSNYIYNFIVLIYFLLNREKLTLYDTIFLIGCILMNYAVTIGPIYRFALYFSCIFGMYLPQVVENICKRYLFLKQPITIFLLYFL